MLLSKNVLGADNQQGSPLSILNRYDPSETTRRTPFSKKEIIAYLQGALHDASLNKGKRYRFTQKGDKWLLILQRLFKGLGYNSWIYKEGKNRDVYTLETLANFLDFNFNLLNLKSNKEQISYIKGFFDAEGGIPTKKSNRFYIQLVQKDQMKLIKLKKVLQLFKISTGIIHNPSKKVDPEYWRMFVSTNSHKLFVDTIGSLHPKKILIFRERVMI